MDPRSGLWLKSRLCAEKPAGGCAGVPWGVQCTVLSQCATLSSLEPEGAGPVCGEKGWKCGPAPPFWLLNTWLLSAWPAWASGNMPSCNRAILQPQPFQAVSTQLTAVLSQTLEECSLWCHLSPKQVFQHPAPAHASGTVSGWGIQGGGRDHLCVALSVLPTKNGLFCAPLSLLKLPFCPGWSPH